MRLLGKSDDQWRKYLFLISELVAHALLRNAT